MNDLMQDWDETPLLRASAQVIDTATQLINETHCTIPGFPTRFNVANIHEIKQLWSVPTSD
ncbi:hypothetical protein SAMN03159488_01895 [Pseudomonas sp. NFIX10]|uniref:hypothetical protein n=1 Tax=unclassified Pseudomonas TaxID=196821 RepID=UPI0008F39984|nr:MULTISPECIES: hypothetical protein [unclassified Pseudomonas]SFB11004.1 hypothetical protein SAMN03159488_01895 [Pseudomonas sp. NFIX10]SFE64422.1 hypothetical protein SAMN03159367_01688 [Pseudomonas sp. NFACC06-1]